MDTLKINQYYYEENYDDACALRGGVLGLLQ